MVKSGIKIYARLKPTKKPAGLYEVEEFEDGPSKLSFTVPKSESSGFVNNKKEIYNFQFNEVFDQRTRQDKVFEAVAQGVVDNCLEGYNGTIFAYGQTGSGKTFTITGGVEKFADRGIIPRTLSYLFQEYSKSPSTIFSTHVSYMEIYNESCYDLLDPEHETSSLEDLPKVILMEGEDGNIHLKNLSMHLAANEEEALNWLFVGDTNRMIAETPMNMASTRSHCIFTIHISCREPGSDTIRKSKLHLVDLAGSERVGKTGVGGALLTEAKYINLSLHFLEQVIVALSEKSRTHIPYRNSMMTSVLRDSLGGNCMTTMIATCAVEKKNIDETISTCRFAQRVAMVKNDALVNEELDPKLMVAHLKQRVQELKDELTLATGEERTDELTEEEKERCEELVQAYIQDVSPEAKLMVGGDMRKISHCFALLKAEILKRSEVSPDCLSDSANQTETGEDDSEPEKPLPSAPPPSAADEKATPSSSAPLKLELEMLQARLKQRDSEIRILLRMMKQERKRADRAETSLGAAGGRVEPVSPVSPDQLSPMRLARSVEGSPTTIPTPTTMVQGSSIGGGCEGSGLVSTQQGGVEESSKEKGPLRGTEVAGGSERQVIGGGGGGGVGVSTSVSTSSSDSEWKAALKTELSRARQEAFDNFRKSVADTTALDQHKKILKIKYSEAKALGERVNTTRLHINKLKSRIEKHRIARGIQTSSEAAVDQREEELVKELEARKADFKQQYDNLRRMKTEIEHVQHLLQKCKVQIQRDFEEWWKKSQALPTTRALSPRAAWHTPSPHLSGLAPPPHQSNSTPYSHAPPLHQPDSSHHSQEHTRVTSPPSSQRLRRHQEAIAAQYSHHQPLPLSSSFGHGNGIVGEQGRVDGTPKKSRASNQSGLYPSSWQQADSISGSHSSESAGRRLEGKGFSHDGKTERDYLSKKKHLFPSDTDHQHSLRLSPQDKDSSFVLQVSKSPLGTQSSIPLTGDTKADADIIAFYKARQKLISKGLR